MGSSYNEIKILGKGQFGEVLLVKNRKNEYYALKKINIKELNNEDIDYCKNEIKILSQFNNDYITKIHDSFIKNDFLNIVMEYGGDSNLKTFIEKYKDNNQLIGEKIIINIFLQICFGLREIHKYNIIHRDIKPENIFIDEFNNIKIGDFGISKKLGTNIDNAKSKVGTLFYAAPEIIKGKYNKKVDIYALGCILYELLTLNIYFIDILIDKKDIKINEMYNTKLVDLLKLLLEHNDQHRPDIQKVIIYIFNYFFKNEIVLTLNVNEDEVENQIYFIDNSNNHNNLKELNELNTEIFINEEKNEFKKNFCPKIKGIYTIKIKFYCFLKDCCYMFYNCKNITNIDLSSFYTKNVTNMIYMFFGCIFNIIDLSSFDTKNVTNMSYMFGNCTNLENANLSSFDSSNATNISYMFYNCKKLKNIDLSSFNTKNMANMYGILFGCINLTKINLFVFSPRDSFLMEGMFKDCSNLVDINVNSISFISIFEEINHLKNENKRLRSDNDVLLANNFIYMNRYMNRKYNY